MIILIVGMLLIFYSILAKKYSLAIGMFFVLLIMGFQEGLQTDYPCYLETFQTGGAGLNNWSDTTKDSELSYIWLTQFCSKIMNFHEFVLLTSIVQCLAMGLMIKNFAVKVYNSFGVLLVFFTTNIMLLQMTAMRQGYAVDCLLFAYYFLGKGKRWWSILFVLIAYGFHNSSLVVIPFYLVLWLLLVVKHERAGIPSIDKASCIKKNPKGFGSAFIAVCLLLTFYLIKYVFFASYINPILQGLEIFVYSGYLDQFEKNTGISWWILLYHSIMIFVVTLYLKNESNLFLRYMALLIIVGFFLSIGTFGFGNLMRINMFFVIFSIVVYPNVAAMIKAIYGKQITVGFILFNMMYLMIFSTQMMLSKNYSDATGFYPFTFSFMNW